MCGIAGVVSYNHSDFKVIDLYLLKIRDKMFHRGPDSGGLWISERKDVGLAHRRLSIIDLSTSANQPLTNESESIRIVFNGEIYNHLEIRHELESVGKYYWKTSHSDTEVILHAFEQWGIECIHKFRGMFAIAIWDNRSEELWLVRDRIGIKPLYYNIQNGRLLFASEIKAILEDQNVGRKIDEESLFHYLSFLTVPAPATLFEGILKLEPGTWLRVNKNGEIEKKKYYDVLDRLNNYELVSEDELSQRILKELKLSVQFRKVSDVPVGVFLSGGIDSSTNVALFSSQAQETVNTFSIGYDQDYATYTNELHYAQAVANVFKTEHHEKILSIDDFIEFLPLMIYLQDEPLADPVCVPVYYVSKLARDNNVIVCQVGEGADELFFGYRGWELLLKLEKMNNLPVPRIIKKIIERILAKSKFSDSFWFEYLCRANKKQPIFWSGSESYTHKQKLSLFSKRMRDKFRDRNSFEIIKPIWEKYCDKADKKDIINWMAYMDLNLRLPELLLMRVDKMSMGVSIEARVPFLDHNIVELAMSIPGRRKYREGKLKYLLKKTVRNLIPDQIIDRKKQGFGAPIQEWYESVLGEKAKKILEEFCTETDYFDYESVKILLDSKYKSTTWPLLNLAMWWKQYIKGSF
ncbi:MAG: asparagine synthase (glutamine-hydrolyzing) [Bacteroidales bacterium]|jgi:asparagine synthase (glutamine-hydrolysing)